MKTLLSILIALTLTGCELEPSAGQEHYTLDGVKLIRPDVRAELAPEMFQQDRYEIGPQSRLLLAFESLTTELGVVNPVVAPVRVSLSVDTSDAAKALLHLKLCPMKTNWMMRANWEWASPLERWNNPGGDIDFDGCVTPLMHPKPVAGYATICFDMTNWAIHYVKSRKLNYGFALISNAPVHVYGDGSSAAAPAIEMWTDRRGSQYRR